MILTGDKKIKLFAGSIPVKAAYAGTVKVYPNSILSVTQSLSFVAAGSSQFLQIEVLEGQPWSITGLPSGWSASAVSGTGPEEVKITASNNTSVETKNGTLKVVSDGLTASCSLSQEAGSRVYGTLVVSLTVADIPAVGGSVSAGTVDYSQTWTWNGVEGSGDTLTTGGTVSYSEAVAAGNLGTTLKARTAIDSLTASVSLNNKTGKATVMVYQAANVIERYGDHYLVINKGTVSIGAAGGSAGFNVTPMQYYTCTTGETGSTDTSVYPIVASSNSNFKVTDVTPQDGNQTHKTYYFNVSASANTSTSSRSTTITVTHGTQSSVKQTFSISQAGNVVVVKRYDLSIEWTNYSGAFVESELRVYYGPNASTWIDSVAISKQEMANIVSGNTVKTTLSWSAQTAYPYFKFSITPMAIRETIAITGSGVIIDSGASLGSSENTCIGHFSGSSTYGGLTINSSSDLEIL